MILKFTPKRRSLPSLFSVSASSLPLPFSVLKVSNNAILRTSLFNCVDNKENIFGYTMYPVGFIDIALMPLKLPGGGGGFRLRNSKKNELKKAQVK